MIRVQYFVFILCIWLTLVGCEEEVAIDIPEGEEQLVVQGHLEQDAPPFVILTRSVGVLTPGSAEIYNAAFVRGAQITITHNGQSFPLQERLLRELGKPNQQLVSEQFGFSLTNQTNKPGFDVYVYTSDILKGKAGQQYHLQINAENKILTAVTSIPFPTPVDSLWFAPHPNPRNDSLVTLWYRYKDPDTLGNQIRYFTSRNSEPFYSGNTSSVFNDEFVNGRLIDFPLERGRAKSAPVNMETDSYFTRGDTVRLKWAAIDYPHYQFWFTLEADRASNGNPLGFPTTVRSNITGGLGIWGGYGVSRHTIIAPGK